MDNKNSQTEAVFAGRRAGHREGTLTLRHQRHQWHHANGWHVTNGPLATASSDSQCAEPDMLVASAFFFSLRNIASSFKLCAYHSKKIRSLKFRDLIQNISKTYGN